MIINSYTGARIVVEPTKVVEGYALTPSGLQRLHPEPTSAPKLKDVLDALPAGGIATGALQMYQLGNTTTRPELVQFFATNNFTPSAADSLADSVLEVVHSVAGKAAFIGLTGGATIYGILEVIEPKWSWKKRVLWSLLAALIIAIVYLLLVQLGVMR